MVRVLHELSALDGGGDARLIYEYYSCMDKTKVHFDFVIYDFYENGLLEQPLRDMGCTIYKLPQIKKDRKACLNGLEKVIKEGNYDVVHSHRGGRGFFVMYYAKKYGIKKRVVHSHVANESVSFIKKMLNVFLSKIAKMFATDLFACGKDAGIYMWGKNNYAKGDVSIMTNAITIDKFGFSQDVREAKRKELGVDDKLVLGIVGRMTAQKNYPFLFRVYKEVLKVRQDVVLVVVGRGLQEEAIKAYARELGIEKEILFLGLRDDVSELLNAFDIFLLPSLFEGLPVVLIEAQANGLKQIVSNTITDEVDITDLIEYLPIDEGEQQWVERINAYKNNVAERNTYSQKVAKAGYDIVVESKKMQNFYLS